MYGIDGEKDLTEQTLDHLTGYDGAQPVRIGNGAFDQRQNDVYGAVLDSVYLHTKHGGRLPQRLWPVLRGPGQRRDRRLEGARPGDLGGARRAAALRLLEADVLGRARPRRPPGGDPRRARPGRAVAGDRRRDQARHPRDTAFATGVFRQHYDTDALDASTLLMPLVRFLPPDDERVVDTVKAIARDLTDHGLVLRYKVEETDDGLHGRGGHVPDLLLLARLRARGDRRPPPREGAAARSCSRTPPRCCCSPRSSTSTPAASSATTRRRSPISP